MIGNSKNCQQVNLQSILQTHLYNISRNLLFQKMSKIDDAVFFECVATSSISRFNIF